MEPSLLAAAAAVFLLAGTVKGVIGLGLPTVSLGLLVLVTDLPGAMALMLAPSFVTNVWQGCVGGNLLALLRRLWPFLLPATLLIGLSGLAIVSADLSLRREALNWKGERVPLREDERLGAALHEIGHAWSEFNLSQEEMLEYVEEREMESWNDPETAWGIRGSEDAANEAMTPAMRLLGLQARHRVLDNKITELHGYPYQNQILLQRLKKEKLRLKDMIERLKNDMIPDLDA